MKPDFTVLVDNVKKVARDAAFNMIPPKQVDAATREKMRAHLVYNISAALHAWRDARRLQEFKVQVDIGEAIRLGERDIPFDAKPGDRFGSSGFVVSSDGKGRGVVFDPHAPELSPGQIRVRVDLQPVAAVEYIAIDFSVADTAY